MERNAAKIGEKSLLFPFAGGILMARRGGGLFWSDFIAPVTHRDVRLRLCNLRQAMRCFISRLLITPIFGCVDATNIFSDNTLDARSSSFGDSNLWNPAPTPFAVDNVFFLWLAYLPVEKVGVWSNFRPAYVISSQIAGRKLGPDPFLLLFQRAAILSAVSSRPRPPKT